MDPDKNLQEQLRIAAEIIDDWSDLQKGRCADVDEVAEKATHLAELVIALDSWLSSGGFLPASWAKKQ